MLGARFRTHSRNGRDGLRVNVPGGWWVPGAGAGADADAGEKDGHLACGGGRPVVATRNSESERTRGAREGGFRWALLVVSKVR